MPIYNDLPGVRRFEDDKSDYIAARTGNTVGVIVSTPFGRIKRPYVVGSQSEFISNFGTPEKLLSGSITSSSGILGTIPAMFVPEYGYGSYAALYALDETSKVVVARDYTPGVS